MSLSTGSATTGFRKMPSFSISTSTRSPGLRNTGGLRAKPTPGGVPVKIKSPGASVQMSEMYEIKIIYRKDQLGGAGILHYLAVEPELDFKIIRLGNFIGGNNGRSERREGVERFAQQPLPAGLCAIASRGPKRRFRSNNRPRAALPRVGRICRPPCPMTTTNSASKSTSLLSAGSTIGLQIAANGGRKFAEQDRFGRGFHAGFAGVIGIVQSHADDLFRFGNGRCG